MNVVRGLTAGAVALLLSACAVFIPGERLPPAESFDILGRVLASNDGRAFSSNFRWRHAADRDEIWLMSPIGQTLAYIESDAGGAVLTAADQQEYRAMSVENLTRRALGWPLPLDRLQHWITGRTVAGVVIMEALRDPHGRLLTLEQDGWRIRYGYPESDTVVLRPRRLDMTQDGQQIRLIVDEWRSGVVP